MEQIIGATQPAEVDWSTGKKRLSMDPSENPRVRELRERDAELEAKLIELIKQLGIDEAFMELMEGDDETSKRLAARLVEFYEMYQRVADGKKSLSEPSAPIQ